MTEKKYRVHDLVKFQYSEIGEYIDENHTDRPLRNDKIVDLLNQLNDENEQLKQQLDDKGIEWLRDNTVWEQMPTNKTTTIITNDFNQSNCITVQKSKIKELEKENEQLKQLLDYADDLIQSHLSEHFIRQWRNFKTGHKEYNDFWEEKLKTYKELKENVE